jgi:mycocerosic acid synthase/polyketide synthase 5
MEIGIDSLMALELRTRIEKDLGVRVPTKVLWSHGSPSALAEYLTGRLWPDPDGAPETAPETAGAGADPTAVPTQSVPVDDGPGVEVAEVRVDAAIDATVDPAAVTT